ncbi:MAG: hypothetical protein ACRDK7_07190 [Solirubrobacteraceae bacterium]
MATSLAVLWMSLLMFCAAADASGPSRPTATVARSELRTVLIQRTAAHHALTSDSNRLKRCRHVHPRHCQAAERAARRARLRWARATRRSSSLAAQIARARQQPSSKQAPTLTVSGAALGWNAIGTVSSYALARKVPGQSTQYSTLTGTSTSPPAVPGATVGYAVRTNVKGSAWSNEVSIAYPAHEPTPTEPTPTPTSPPTTESALPSSPMEPEPALPSSPVELEPAFPSGPVEPFVKGIDTNLQGWGSQVPQVVSEMSSLGVKWEREDLAWSVVESQKGVFNWTSFDKVMAVAKEHGLTILPIVGYAPSWASPGDATDYAAFVKAAVERYGPGTSANLQWWELWNEPYFAYAWSGKTPEPGAYARDALAAAQAAKSVSSSVKLLLAADYQDASQTGGSSPWETTWIDDMFATAPTLGKWIDGVSVHPYGDDPALPLAEAGGWKDVDGQWAFQRIDTIRAKFLAHGVNVPFWITEVGWSTAEVSEAVEAQNYADLVPQIAARPWIRALFPYCLREDSSTPTRESEFGLLKYGSWEPKAAFYKLQEGLKTLS